MHSRMRRSGNRIVNQITRLPRIIVGAFSRSVIRHGVDLMGIGGRTSQLQQHPPLNFQQQHPQQLPIVAEEWSFLSSFEQHYGSTHPFFYACRFAEALKIAEDEHKCLFMYLHSPDHPFTSSFCKETLCSEVVVEFLDANFVCWGTLSNSQESVQMVAMLNPACFPCCAVVAPAPGNSLVVLRQLEGPLSPAELTEILQRTLEEQTIASGSRRANEQEEKIRANRGIREEQDAAYFAALQIDKEKKRVENSHSKESKRGNYPAKKPQSVSTEETATGGKDVTVSQILIRCPNGERIEKSFSSSDKVEAVYRYIDSLNLPGIGSYRIVSSFPRRVYGVEQMGFTLKDAGLHPKATLFLDLTDFIF